MDRTLTEDQRELLNRQLALLAAARKLRPVARIPYHGHLRIETEAGMRDLLLADNTQRSPDVALIDWRRAPLAEAFFTCLPGEDYEIDSDERVLKGRVLERNLVHFENSELVAIDTGDHLLERNPQGAWLSGPAPGRSLGPAPGGRLGIPGPEDLDPDQARAVKLPASEPVLVCGPAGSGKTTAALQRMALAVKQRSPRRDPVRALTIAPTEGLRCLHASLLKALGLRQVQAVCFEGWAVERARHLFSGLPTRLSRDTPAGLIRFKRHPALAQAIARLAAAQPKGPTRRADLLELFGDRALLEGVVAAAPQDLPLGLVAEVREHTRIQFADPSEQEFEHVLAEHLVTLDGKPIDEGTPLEDARSWDAEDAAVLFGLDRCRAQAAGRTARRPDRIDVLLIDEVQEFAPLELALLQRALAPGGTLIAAGDEDQQLDPASGFAGFGRTLESLGVPNAERIRLRASHRCPPVVAELARGVLVRGGLDRLPPSEYLAAKAHASACHQVDWLGQALSKAVGRDPDLRLAVICRDAPAARELAAALTPMLGVRLSPEGESDFGPGVNVTSVAAVRGLEFDLVVLPDASAQAYPDTPGDRRSLYVAATRTSGGLCLANASDWTPLLLPACSAACRG